MSFCSEHFPDDASVPDQTDLLRRIPPWHVVSDDNVGGWRPSSAAFEDDDDGDPMSVYLSTVILRESRQPESVLAGHEGYSLAAITAGLARANNQTVHPDPLPEESSHAVVCGEKRRPKNNSPRKRFARAAVWIVLNPPN